jgi:hypothetical protein
MSEYEITHVRKDTRADPDRRIDAMGSSSFSCTPMDTLIAWYQQGHRFFVAVGQTRVYLELMRSSAGRLFFRTMPDGRYDNNLYALPPC